MSVVGKEVVSTRGGRGGRSRSADGKIDLELSPPGSGGPGSNPEQLFGAAYSACFGGAVLLAASQSGSPLRGEDVTVTAAVTVHKDGEAYSLGVTLDTELPGLDPDQAATIVRQADSICLYSNAVRGNIAVRLLANGAAVE